MRIGTFYRSCVLEYLGVEKSAGGKILDVGCHDGYFLSNYDSKFKVGLDLAPVRCNINMVAADASFLPFKIKFDKIFAFDVIEHIAEDKTFLLSLCNSLSENGELVLTTPSKNFKIFPIFLTPWLSRRWGHIRIGYSQEDFEEMLSHGSKIEVERTYWNAPFWRFFYFPLRILWQLAPTLSKKILLLIARLDSKFPRGRNGYLLIKIKKVEE